MEYINIIYTRKQVYNNNTLDTLYKQALLSNFINLWLLGPLAYYVAVEYLSSVPFPVIISAPGMIAAQGIIYNEGHKYLHNSELYWIHKFHHTFNNTSFVLPISANAVSIQEFVLLYILPILSGVCLFRPSENVLITTTMMISIANITIHSPILYNIKYPEFMVSPQKHLDHHNKSIKSHYSAPIIDTQYLLDKLKKPNNHTEPIKKID